MSNYQKVTLMIPKEELSSEKRRVDLVEIRNEKIVFEFHGFVEVKKQYVGGMVFAIDKIYPDKNLVGKLD